REGGRRLHPRPAGRRDRRRSHQGRARRGARGHGAGPHVPGGSHRVRVARARDRRSRLGRVSDAPRRGDRQGHDARVLIPLAEIEAARDRIAGAAVRTPLVRVPDTDIWLKLENLQPVASFKIRGATNAIRAASPEQLAGGVVTASAGNMAQGVAWAAREAGVPATIICPDHAPQAKLERIERLGGRVIQIPWAEWWQVIVDSHFEGVDGLFVHPVQDELVMAGNGTIGLEIVEDLPDVDTVLVPYGGGGLACGIAAALRGSGSRARVLACEVETAAPLSAALAAGAPVATP